MSVHCVEFNAGHSFRLSNLPEPLDPEQSLCLTRSNRDSKALKASTQAPSPVVVVQIQFLCALVHNTHGSFLCVTGQHQSIIHYLLFNECACLMAIQLVLEFRKSQICLLASALPQRADSPRTGRASMKPFSSAKECADRGGRCVPAVWAATGVQRSLRNVGSPPEGRASSGQRFLERAQGARPYLESTRYISAECHVCFKSSRLG